MIIVEKNLEQLCAQYQICDKTLVDDFSIKLQLGTHYFSPKSKTGEVIVCNLNNTNPSELFGDKQKIVSHLTLLPGAQVITCTKHKYKIPLDHFGLVQTKGTLARLFVMATCNDGQVEPGFEGYITLEIVNLSPWTIEIPLNTDIAQLYLYKCSSVAERGYNGRYAKLSNEGPTIPIFL